jgi:hypothetical protein
MLEEFLEEDQEHQCIHVV